MTGSKKLYSTPQDNAGFGGAFSSAFASQDLASVKIQLDGINVSATTVSSSLNKAFSSASASGRSFNTTLSTIAASLTQVLAGAGGPTVAPFADGGIVSSPTYFGAGSSMGLMGERGAEAILPLARGPNGQLGVAANGGGAARAASVTVNIQTPDAESFRRSESQIAAALARAVERGRRSL